MTATYEKIATTTLGSAQADITFSSISGAYTDLVIIYTLNAATTTSSDTIIYALMAVLLVITVQILF
jgi:hypothetical protein